MKRLQSLLCLCFLCSSSVRAAVEITRSSNVWMMTNGDVKLALSRSGTGLVIDSLRHTNGGEWAVPGTPIGALLHGPSVNLLGTTDNWVFVGDKTSNLVNGAKQLTSVFKSAAGGVFSFGIRLYPKGAVIEFSAKIENLGQRILPLLFRIDPLCMSLASPAGKLKPYSSVANKHGFYPAGNLTGDREFNDWLVLQNEAIGEAALIGGEPGIGVLDWRTNTVPVAGGTFVSAGNVFRTIQKSKFPPAYEVSPGEKIETPIAFLALARGDADDVGNEAFRYLRRYVFLSPPPNAPLAAYSIWLTEPNSEETILREMKFAQRMGFDAFYHDASWSEGASIVPGMNNWTKGLGSYRESPDKFPHGIKALSDAVQASGMKFGLWVDPGNVDAARVDTGEIKESWLAMIDEKVLNATHPSLNPTKQLCLGDPEVVQWIEKQLSRIIDEWNLTWIKWDPSATVSYACNRTDHGHSARGGAYAAYRGRQEILSYLMHRFPNLIGFECDPSLSLSRTNPGPKNLLPGGYTNEFIAGPMVSPFVWGSLATAGVGDARASHLVERWYNASALDYYIRKSLTHGIAFGNINGMAAQLLSAAPPGYIEAFQRNLLNFKNYRHLLLDDVYHPRSVQSGWSTIQYVNADTSASVVFIFRDESKSARNTLYLRGIDAGATYSVASLNEQPGKERRITGISLMQDGVSVILPNEWLSKGDGLAGKEFDDQLQYGSDILLLQRVPQ